MDDLSCSACTDGAQFCSALRFFGEEAIGEDYVCRDACVPTDAGAYWCADDTSCCDAEASCDAAGFCRLPGEGTTAPVDTPDTSGSGSSSGGDVAMDADAAGCGCRGGSAPGTAWWLWLCVFGLRRRR